MSLNTDTRSAATAPAAAEGCVPTASEAIASELARFTEHYIKVALCHSFDGTTRLAEKCSKEDISPETLERMQEDCREFFTARRDAILCTDAPGDRKNLGGIEFSAYYFWMARAHPGQGFPVHSWPAPYNRILTAAARAFGAVQLYVHDDGKIHDVPAGRK